MHIKNKNESTLIIIKIKYNGKYWLNPLGVGLTIMIVKNLDNFSDLKPKKIGDKINILEHFERARRKESNLLKWASIDLK